MSIKTLRRAASLLLLCAISFGLGVFFCARGGWFQAIVAITIVNRTDQDLSELVLEYKNSGVNGCVKLPALANGARTVARFWLSGEGGYTIRAKLADGTALLEGEGYVESGYTMTEVLTMNTTKAKLPAFAGCT